MPASNLATDKPPFARKGAFFEGGGRGENFSMRYAKAGAAENSSVYPPYIGGG